MLQSHSLARWIQNAAKDSAETYLCSHHPSMRSKTFEYSHTL
jgi:hypothetical protein